MLMDTNSLWYGVPNSKLEKIDEHNRTAEENPIVITMIKKIFLIVSDENTLTFYLPHLSRDQGLILDR